MSSIIPAHIKDNVTAVLLSRTEGILLSEFLSDYYNLHHEPLKFREFGFPSLQNFLKSIPDVARMVETDEFEILIIGVGEPDSYKPAIPMKAQGFLQKQSIKSAKVEKFPHATGIPSLLTSPTQDDADWKPDHKGLWSVCLPLNMCPTRIPERLSAIFTQAGIVVDTNFTDKRVFIRYAHKKEALLAIEMFSDLNVTIANGHAKKTHQKEKHNEKMNGMESGRMSDYGASVESLNAHMSNRNNMKKMQPYMNNSFNGNVNKVLPVLEQVFGNCHSDEMATKKGYHSEQEIQNGLSSTSYQDSKFRHRKDRSNTASSHTGSRPGTTALFVANIECEDEFKEMIRPYNPVTIKIVMNKGIKIAFINMSNEDNARQAIANLHNKWQKTKSLTVHFDKNQDNSYSDSVSDGSISDTPSGARSKKMKPKEMSRLEAGDTCMPKLIHASELSNNEENLHLDCSVHVANFPSNLPESTLRNAFVKYHVFDICMEGSDTGSNDATLYLATVYDAIQAVMEMDGSCIFGRPIKVDVPSKNTILRAVVEKQRQRVLSPPYGNASLQRSY